MICIYFRSMVQSCEMSAVYVLAGHKPIVSRRLMPHFVLMLEQPKYRPWLLRTFCAWKMFDSNNWRKVGHKFASFHKWFCLFRPCNRSELVLDICLPVCAFSCQLSSGRYLFCELKQLSIVMFSCVPSSSHQSIRKMLQIAVPASAKGDMQLLSRTFPLVVWGATCAVYEHKRDFSDVCRLHWIKCLWN